jgi:hypothetical protein
MALKIKRWSVIIDQRMYQAIMKVKMENINYRNELYIYIYIYIYKRRKMPRMFEKRVYLIA